MDKKKKILTEKRVLNCLKNNAGASRALQSQQTTSKHLLCHILSQNNHHKSCYSTGIEKTLYASSCLHRLTDSDITGDWWPHHQMISNFRRSEAEWKKLSKCSHNTTCRKTDISSAVKSKRQSCQFNKSEAKISHHQNHVLHHPVTD